MVLSMKHVQHTSSAPNFAIPAWAKAQASDCSLWDAAFIAGSALNTLDQYVRLDPEWAGAWRQRMALKCAVASTRLTGRRETEADIRDAWVLRKASDDPGPAGNVYGAWKMLGSTKAAVDTAMLRDIVSRFGLRWNEDIEIFPQWVDDALQSGQAAPFAAAMIARKIHAVRPDAELLGLWLADYTLARALRWPVAVPLLITQRHSSLFRREGGAGRLTPDADGFDKAICLALAKAAGEACVLASDLARRAERLSIVVPKLRAKGARDAIRILMNEDAVSGTLQTPSLTRWASRRLFDRLLSFNAIRELSGRDSFRIFGL